MIFGDSDEEGTKDIDFLGIDEDDEESDEVNSESGNEGASDSDSEEVEEWWTTDLSNIVVDKFSAQSGIVVKMGVNPKADDFFWFDVWWGSFWENQGGDTPLCLHDVCKPEVKAYFVGYHGDAYSSQGCRLLINRHFPGQWRNKESCA